MAIENKKIIEKRFLKKLEKPKKNNIFKNNRKKYKNKTNKNYR